MEKWTRALYQPNLPLYPGRAVTASGEHIALSLKAAEEGIVLLKNDRQILPLSEGDKIALLGKGSFDYVKGGGGSGDVYTLYVRNIYEGLKETRQLQIFEPAADFYRSYAAQAYENGAVPGMLAEPQLSIELLQSAAAFTDTAVIVFSRFSGEGWDRSDVECNLEYNPWENETTMPKMAGRIFPKGDFYLTDEEQCLLEQAKQYFKGIIVLLNTGGMISTAWIRDDEAVQAAAIIGQGGMEGGLAAARMLTGLAVPSGKLVDTYAAGLDDYPGVEHFHDSFDYVDYTEDIYVGYRYFLTIPGAAERIVYPFGYGLSYTTFDTETVEAFEKDGVITVKMRITNTGRYAGKEVAQVYYGAPQGLLQKPARQLAAFEKTRLLQPGETQLMMLRFKADDMASFDDLGRIRKSAYVLETGSYVIYAGTSSLAPETGFAYEAAETRVVRQLSAKCVPHVLKERMLADGSMKKLPVDENPDMNACLFEKMMPGTEEAVVPENRYIGRSLVMKPYGETGKPLMDVVEGRLSLDEFAEQLSDDQLISLLGGQPNTGVSNTFGYGNIPEYGVPNIATADGPAGVRIDSRIGVRTTAWPCASTLASSWDPALVQQVGRAGGEELKENNLSVWLTPAVNIHRNPLCGRNFEYYAEDPYLAGKMGAAMVRGIQSNHVSAAVKHFAVNNKETNRKHSDSRVSERALREIYLRAFEIIVQEADPWVIMSSYNALNGVRVSENRELLEDILRGEWHFKGMVTSDWWTRGEHYKEILAGNDVKMAAGYPERVRQAMDMGALTREDLLRCAKRVLSLIMKID